MFSVHLYCVAMDKTFLFNTDQRYYAWHGGQETWGTGIRGAGVKRVLGRLQVKGVDGKASPLSIPTTI